MNYSSRIGLTTLMALSSPVMSQLQAADWPQFRGPNRDGAWNETGITESLPQGGLRFPGAQRSDRVSRARSSPMAASLLPTPGSRARKPANASSASI